MTSLSSCWHSSSLTFVSSQNHQQPTRTRPLTDCPGHNNSSQTRFRLSSLTRSKMAKIFAVTIAALLVMIIIGLVLSEEVAPAGRNRARTKTLPLRKRRLSTTTLAPPVEEVSEVNTDLDENPVSEEEEVTTTTTTSKPPPPPKSKKPTARPSPPLSTRANKQSVSAPAAGCGECDPNTCRNQPDSGCPLGLVLDKCSCCMVCGAGEGNRCYDASNQNDAVGADVGVCGKGLFCNTRKDLDPNEPAEALCECRDKRLVCGNDYQTYPSECKLREASHKKEGLSIALWGPCVSAPTMPSSIENITVGEGEDASLSCEVKGFPSPIIHWEFLSTRSRGPPLVLPGDDSSVVVTVRGGPEETMSTSWIQIIAVSDSRQGTYYCVATNANGATRMAGTVTIGEGAVDIPPQEEEEELHHYSRHLSTDDYVS